MIDPLADFLRTRIFNRRRRKTKDDCLLSLDIGTEFVKALIFRLKDEESEDGLKKVGVVIGTAKQRQKRGNMIAGAIADIDGVADACRGALKEASRFIKIRPRKAIIGVAGESVKGATSSFIFERSSPEEEIELAEVQNLIQKAQWKAYEVMRKELAWETCRPEIEIKPINALLSEVKIDGYRVTNPLGFSGKEVFLSIFNVYASLVHLQAIEKIAAKLGLELLSITAQSYALAKSLEFAPHSGAIFIDIGGGTTDIALVRKGRVEGIKSISLAGRSFTKRIGQVLSLDLDQAEDLKISHSEKRLGHLVQRKLNELLKHDAFVWLRGIELILDDFGHEEPFPTSIMVCGGGSLLPWIRKILNSDRLKEHWQRKFNFASGPQVCFIEPENIKNIVDATNTLKSSQDITPMALASLGLELAMNEEKPLPSVLRKVVRMMR